MRTKSYTDYFVCLLAGIYVAETLAPRLSDASCFEKFLLFGVTTYGGALMGSYVYKLLSFNPDACNCDTCCCNPNYEDSDSE